MVKNARVSMPKAKSYGLAKQGIDMFIDPPEDMLIKKKGIDAVKEIRKLR